MDEDPDAEAYLVSQQHEIDRPEEAILDPHLEYYSRAWMELQHDRHFGAMGGIGGIYYSAISRYAADHFVHHDDFSVFHTLIRAQDTEYLNWAREKQDEEEENRKNNEGQGR